MYTLIEGWITSRQFGRGMESKGGLLLKHPTPSQHFCFPLDTQSRSGANKTMDKSDQGQLELGQIITCKQIRSGTNRSGTNSIMDNLDHG